MDSRRVNINEFFTTFQIAKPGQLSKSEFCCIISQLHIDAFCNFDPQKAFTEFAQLKKTIDINYFIDVFKNTEPSFKDNKVSELKRNA